MPAGVWGYWSTDGLGLFEYMQLAEELKTEPVWVINNGVAHADSELLAGPVCANVPNTYRHHHGTWLIPTAAANIVAVKSPGVQKAALPFSAVLV